MTSEIDQSGFVPPEDEVLPPPERVLGTRRDPVTSPEEGLDAASKMAFDGEVAERFEESVIPRQIPDYDQMRQWLARIVTRVLKPDTTLVDIGTSNGRMIRDVVAHYIHTSDDRLRSCRYYGYDNSADQLAVAHRRIDELAKQAGQKLGHIRLGEYDLRQGLPTNELNRNPVSVVTSVFTLQFIPLERRQQLVQDIYDALEPGGVFVLTEKVLNDCARMTAFFEELYLDEKARQGLSQNQILQKRDMLEGVLVPLTHQGNVDQLTAVGFKPHNIQLFWRALQFEGIIAMK